MSHAVHFRDTAGESQLEDAPSLEAALERVEGLRNDDGATEIRVFKEVPIEVRTYYRVVAVDETATEAQAPAAPVVEVAEVAEPPAPPTEPPSGAMVMSRPPVAVAHEDVVEDAEAAADAPGNEHRRQLFSRS